MKVKPQYSRARRLTCLLNLGLFAFASFLLPKDAGAQTSPGAQPPDALHQLDSSIESLVKHVSPSVVQIMVMGYGSAEGSTRGQANVVIGMQRSIGSGVIVDPEGYIVTNAHVVNGAQRIQVVVPPLPDEGGPKGADLDPRGKTYDARIVGVSDQLDLAVIKIEAHGLPALAIRKSTLSRQGEMVLAFGSPEGLQDTVTMGVVSSVARQTDPDSPLVYIQTDTPINPGNSGGPLVNSDGDLIGINTFILSSSGGNQGLGFAIPVAVLGYAYPQLLKYGHIHRPEIGVLAQTITPEMAEGLHLGKDFGVIVSDVLPGGPADQAGLHIQDIILSVDGTPTTSLPMFTNSLYLHESGEHAKLEVLRGTDKLQLDIPLIEQPHKADNLADIADPAKDLVPPLGILAIDLNLNLAKTLPDLRIPTGVIVAARTLGSGNEDIPLQTGDVIHGLNGTPITNLAGLRVALAKLKPGDAVALQVERYMQIIYVSFLL